MRLLLHYGTLGAIIPFPMANWRNEHSTGGGEEGAPVSRAERLMKAHPDITVIQHQTGDINITQTSRFHWRHLHLRVVQEPDSQHHNPSVLITGYETPAGVYPFEELAMKVKAHGLITVFKLHVQDDEQVRPEVGYMERQPVTSELNIYDREMIQSHSYPIPAKDITSIASKGLEMLKAYKEASPEQRNRIRNAETGYHGYSQIVDTTRPDIDAYIAEASPVLGTIMRSENISYTHVGTIPIYALNGLRKVTRNMLPDKMPPVPRRGRLGHH